MVTKALWTWSTRKLMFLFSGKFSFNVYFERDREWAGEGQRERGIRRIPRRLHTVSAEPNMGFKLTNREIMTWVEVKSQTLNRDTQEPFCGQFYTTRKMSPDDTQATFSPPVSWGLNYYAPPPPAKISESAMAAAFLKHHPMWMKVYLLIHATQSSFCC